MAVIKLACLASKRRSTKDPSSSIEGTLRLGETARIAGTACYALGTALDWKHSSGTAGKPVGMVTIPRIGLIRSRAPTGRWPREKVQRLSAGRSPLRWGEGLRYSPPTPRGEPTGGTSVWGGEPVGVLDNIDRAARRVRSVPSHATVLGTGSVRQNGSVTSK